MENDLEANFQQKSLPLIQITPVDNSVDTTPINYTGNSPISNDGDELTNEIANEV